MPMARGFLEILKLTSNGEPKHFDDFTKIRVKNKGLSSATVTKRLNELLALEAIKEAVGRSRAGRRIIAYIVTEKGRRVIKSADAFRDIVYGPS